ncbi:MAG: hypothetical protein K6F94_03495 [Bacteroidaceae bacterium]|nr:hypothetical protein [Bacteroidaceae bacterium]
MKKILVAVALCLGAVNIHAQEPAVPKAILIDQAEDVEDVTTIDDIVRQQENVTTRLANEKHFNSVWGRQRFFNISKNTSTIAPAENLESGVAYNGGLVPDFKSNWGVSIQLGRNYRLHKKPIANTLQFYIDYVGMDLNANHFKAEDADKLYNSTTQPIEIVDPESHGTKIDKYFRTPWNLAKYEFNYAMMLGPSLTIAPFNYVKGAQGLHHLRMNFYFHIGYHASILWMQNDSDRDVNTYSGQARANFEVMEKNMKMDWGHGLIHSYGFSFTWKMIGIGYEHRAGSVKYKSLNTADFGNESYKFNSTTNRIFLQFRLGK